MTGRDPKEDYFVLSRELAAFSEHLAALPQIVVLNKMDITGAEERALEVRAALPPGTKVFEMSAATGAGVVLSLTPNTNNCKVE